MALTLRKQKIKELFNHYGILLTDEELENIGEAIGDTVRYLADEVEELEPYATRSIQALREASGNIESIINED